MWDSASREPPIMEAMRCMVPASDRNLGYREPRGAIGSGDEAVERCARGRRAGRRSTTSSRKTSGVTPSSLGERTLGERLGRTEEARLEVVGWRVGNP